MQRRHLIAAAALPAAPAFSQPAAARTIRVIPQANLTSLDPIWTTAVVTRNHGFMVYDQLCAQDAAGEIRPQMAQGWALSEDRLTLSFTLRDGLRFHDGDPVLARDCVASIKRWARRDPFMQVLAASIADVETVDDTRFRFRLHRPVPLLVMALGQNQFP